MGLFDKAAKALGREDILNASDIEIESVEVPEWGGVVFVKGMTGTERDAFEASLAMPDRKPGEIATADLRDLRAKLCVQTMCDEGGKLIFSDKDVEALGKKSAAALQHVFKVAQRLSGIGEDDLEDMKESLEGDPLEDSASD